jgi:hypothetical protein
MLFSSLPGDIDETNLSLGNNIDLENFGLFEKASPNYTTFYPGITEADWKPEDSDFIYPVFRMLSETIVHRNWNPISFSKPGVLKASMAKLLGQTIYVDHEMAIGNAIGSIYKVFWQDAYETTYQGKKVKVPAGINAMMKIDAKSNPRLARGILMEPPSIHSESVTVAFAWEKSHPKLSDDEFFSKLGSYDEKKKLIHKVASEIRLYYEASLVAHGADPWAKLVKEDGKVNLPGMGKVLTEPFKAALAKNITPYTCYDYKTCVFNDKVENSATPSEHIDTTKNNFKTAKMKEKLILLALAFGITLPSESEDSKFEAALDEISNKSKDLLGLPEQVTNLTSEKSQLETQLSEKSTELSNLKNQLTALEKEALTGRTALTHQRNEAIRLYRVLKADQAKKEVEETIENANYEAAKAFAEQYATELGEKAKNSASGGSNQDDLNKDHEALRETFQKRRLGLVS